MWGLIDMIAAISSAPKVNGNGNGNGTLAALANAPLWLKLLGIFGPMPVIVMFLVYTGSQTLPKIQELLLVAIANQEKILGYQRDLLAEQRNQTRIIQQVCAEHAANAIDRNLCWPQPKGQ